MWEEREENNFVDTTGELPRGLRNENFAQIQASVAKEAPFKKMIWTDQEGSCINVSSLNLLSLSRDYVFEEVGLTGVTDGRRQWSKKMEGISAFELLCIRIKGGRTCFRVT